ncbi:DgyrCDS5362 [Dimorphilus gyrociliatus]|uniref:DgyrCDS5362 n=1 Tax=Dimorphilus gyrociliatus TaxID=2664684 RepID=A0A7I8VPI0_9ANNE|nr:DgyrCDS5362 [Dimorphilus gyrociliatus]
MNVKFFPFDEQDCDIFFVSWTYNKNEVDILHEKQAENSSDVNEFDTIQPGIDLSEFYENGEFDIMSVRAVKGYQTLAGSEEEPKIENSHDLLLKNLKISVCSCMKGSNKKFDRDSPNSSRNYYSYSSSRSKTQVELIRLSEELESGTANGGRHLRNRHFRHGRPTVRDTIESAIYIADHLKEEDDKNRAKEDWKYIALVIDRLFFCVYISTVIVGTLAILLQAPQLYDSRTPYFIEGVTNFKNYTSANSTYDYKCLGEPISERKT